MRRVRTFRDGKLKISGDGLLEHDEKGMPISGDVRNSWAGLSTFQILFIQEHNAVCDMLKVGFNSIPSRLSTSLGNLHSSLSSFFFFFGVRYIHKS